MNISKTIDTILVFGKTNQVLFGADKPRFSFPVNERKEKDVTILKKTSPVWTPIVVEFPLNMFDVTSKWITEKSRVDTRLICKMDDQIIEEWEIREAYPMHSSKAKSRTSGFEVIKTVIGYSWARRIK